MALLLGLVLFALGAGLLTRKHLQFDLAVQSNQVVQARALARAGLEDALAKLCRDQKFPPDSAWDQSRYSYSESIVQAHFEGMYEVEVDQSLKEAPWQLIQVTATGQVASCRYSLRGELALVPAYRWRFIEDLGVR